MDLYPTKTRVFLLADIRDGKVTEEWYDDDDEPGTVWLYEYPGRRTRVTGKVAEMKLAGWVETDPADDDLHVRGIRLKPAGEAVLAEHTTKEG